MTTKKTTKKSGSKTTTKKKAGSKRQQAKPASTATTKQVDAKRPTQSKPAKAGRPKKVSGLDLAASAIVLAFKPLNAKTIAERVIAAGWKSSGSTPWATLYSAIVREIRKKNEASRFRKSDRGLFVAARLEGTKP